MSTYTATNWQQGTSPPINAANLNHLENGVVGIPGTYFITPYHLTTNPTVNSGATLTLTCTGVGGIPLGATGVIIGVNLYSVTAGGTLYIYPTGATPGIYANLTPQWTANNQYTGMGMVIMPLGGGQITCKAVGQNMILQDWYIYAYII